MELSVKIISLQTFVFDSVLLAVVFKVLMVDRCEAIVCFDLHIDENGYLERKATCEGDLCVYYQPGPESRFLEEKSCATGFQLPLGCFNGTDKSGTMCICDTDYCNDGRIESIVETPQYSCFRGDRPSEKTANGSFCTMRYGMQTETNETSGFVGAVLDSYPLPPGDVGLSDFDFYPGILYSSNLKNGSYRSIRYTCTGDFCNNITLTDMPYTENVVCFDGEIHYPDTPECMGEFCVFAQDLLRNKSHRFCLSTANLSSEYSHKAGLYQYKTTSFYLCQEKGCNFNETTARIPEIEIPEPEPIVVADSWFSLKNIQPEYIFASLSFLSGTVFLSITILVAKYGLIDPAYTL